jgi:hypothetical protein
MEKDKEEVESLDFSGVMNGFKGGAVNEKPRALVERLFALDEPILTPANVLAFTVLTALLLMALSLFTGEHFSYAINGGFTMSLVLFGILAYVHSFRPMAFFSNAPGVGLMMAMNPKIENARLVSRRFVWSVPPVLAAAFVYSMDAFWFVISAGVGLQLLVVFFSGIFSLLASKGHRWASMARGLLRRRSLEFYLFGAAFWVVLQIGVGSVWV